MRGVLGNLLALVIAWTTLGVAAWMGVRWAVFGIIMTGVFLAGYALTYAFLRTRLRGRSLRFVAFLTVPLWMAAGVGLAHVTYNTPVDCGPGARSVPFNEVAGQRSRPTGGRSQELCLPELADVFQTLRRMTLGEDAKPRIRR